MPQSLVILAAGIGSRFGGLKQIDPVGTSGEFIIDYSIYDAIRAGFTRVVFVIRHDMEAAFRESIGSRISEHIDVDYAFQELTDLPEGMVVPESRAKPWGTGHAVLAARDRIRNQFGVINADDFYGRRSYEVLSQFMDETVQDDSQYAMVGYSLEKTLSDHGTVSRGICKAGDDDFLQEVEEITKIGKGPEGVIVCDERELKGNDIASMNIWGFKPSLFDHLSREFVEFMEKNGNQETTEFYLPAAIQGLITSGDARVKVLETSSIWMGITNREDKQKVVDRLQGLVDENQYPARLWE